MGVRWAGQETPCSGFEFARAHFVGVFCITGLQQRAGIGEAGRDTTHTGVFLFFQWEKGGRQSPEEAVRLRRCKGEGCERIQTKIWKRRRKRKVWGWNQLNPLLTPTPHTPAQTCRPCPGTSSQLDIVPASVSCRVRTHQTRKILLVLSQEQQHQGLH